MTTTSRLFWLAQWIMGHRPDYCRVEGDVVVVGLGWVNTERGTSGVEEYRVRTMAQARMALGY